MVCVVVTMIAIGNLIISNPKLSLAKQTNEEVFVFINLVCVGGIAQHG